MADIITPILSIVSVLCSCSGSNRCCYLLDLQENKDALNIAMEELKATRDDVKRRVDESENNPNELMKRTHEVDSWLQHVQAIEDEVLVQVIQKADQEIEGRCFGGYIPKNCCSARKIGKLVIRKLEIVNDLRGKGSFGDVAYELPPPLVQKESVMDLTVGTASMFEKVWRSLADDDVRIMGLYGYGGVGKTTLLKQINNEFLKSTTTNSHGFDVVILVVVSKAVNIDAIQMEIGKRLGLSSPDRTSIFNALTKKKFVLLLDDIWERLDLQSIGVPHPENGKSKVIFTTRSETVCGHMDANKKFRVECLQWDEAWTLFQEKVGNESLNSHPKVPELAEVVARECSGLPLALITIGRAMSAKKSLQEWNHAITTLRRAASDFPGMGDEVLPLLKLSYDSLRNDTIKSCFLYCALYPEDWSIDKSQVIDYWIGEGFLNEFGNNVDEARNYGHDVIGSLKGACLLELESTGEDDQETHVKMHDTIRDLALWIVCECGIKRDKHLIIEMSDLTSERLWHNVERIYLRSFGSRGEEIKIAPPKCPNLLTLIYDSSSRCHLSIPQNFFQFMPLLRVLDLSYSFMATFPTSITQLLELQYLSLQGTGINVLPEELRKLVKLKYLNLSDMSILQKIPSGVIGSLIELRVLNLHGYSRGGDWDIEEVMYNLKHLNDLRITINTQHNLNKLLSNQNLQMCTRRLDLFASPSSSTTTLGVGVDMIRSVRKLELLSNLETLSLRSLPELMNMNMEVWEENHYYMAQKLHLHSYFQNLSQISIWECNALKDLAWVGYVSNLNTLSVVSCEELEEMVIVVDDFEGTERDKISTIIFKRLKTLKMRCLPKLKSICRNALAFTCLESLEVDECPQLKKLPFDSGSNVNNTLQEIYGGKEWWNELQWEEDHDDVKSKFLPYFVSMDD